MKYCATLILCFLSALLAGCQGRTESSLAPFPVIDKVVVGQLKSTKVFGEITDAKAIEELRTFANQQRQGAWIVSSVIHGASGVSVSFYSNGSHLGYFAHLGNQFYTNGKSGKAFQQATPENAAKFLALIPAHMRPANAQDARPVIAADCLRQPLNSNVGPRPGGSGNIAEVTPEVRHVHAVRHAGS